MKPASVNRKLEALRRFCRWAHATGKLRTNVAAELKLARAPRGTRPKGLLPAEGQALLRAAGQSRRALVRRNYAVVQLLLQAGLRVSEASMLRIEDLEIRERHGKVRVCGKGNKERYVPLNATARRALQTYLDEREETGTQDPVFLSETGAALSVRSIQSLISELARRAGIARIAVSAHTFALGYLKRTPASWSNSPRSSGTGSRTGCRSRGLHPPDRSCCPDEVRPAEERPSEVRPCRVWFSCRH